MSKPLHRLLIAALPLVAVAGACSRTPPGGDTPSKTTTTSAPSRPRVALQVPSLDELPQDDRGARIRRGRELAMRTSEELPAIVGADLHCTSCHLDGATKANAGPWVGLTAVYPEYRARAGREITIEDRVDECLERSMNGRALPHDSPEMQAFVAYIDWLSTGVPKGSEVVGRGFKRLEPPPNVDGEAGKAAYLARCASCHGEGGEGKRTPEGAYQFPPLWGDRTFNIGAGMARLDTAAAFVRHNMPLGQPESLTVRETYDIAAYFTQQRRADFAGRAADWPRGGKPRDARY